MTRTTVMTRILNGLHQILPKPFSLLNLPHHHSRPNKGKNMPVLNHPNLQPARIQQRRKNVRKHKIEQQHFDIERRKKSEQEMIDDELELLTTKN